MSETIRPAASVLLVREAPRLEVFVQHRATTMDFAAGAVVFPGGRLDPADAEAALDPGLAAEHARAWSRTEVGATPRGAAALLACAVREVAEETGAVLAPGALRPWANWVTPPGPPRRFDTYFFLATEAATPRHLTSEARHSEWLPVADLLQGAADGTRLLMRPTHTLLNELDEVGTLAGLLALPRDITPVRRDRPGDPTPQEGME